MTRFSLLLVCVACFGQTPNQQLPPANGTANLPVQKVGPNDLIAVTVYDSPELSRTLRINADGSIRLPMVKQQIKAAGLMPNELEQAIADVLKAEQLIVEPMVTVTVAEYASHPISIAGAVKMPLTFQAAAPVTLLEAIAKAGGLSPEAGGEILVTRKDGALAQRIQVKALINGADPAANVTLTGGEEVRVPEVGKVFVIGNVKKAGAYPLQTDSETGVLKLLAMAEGLTPNAGHQAFIMRRDAAGKQVPVELKKIMDRKEPDTVLLAGDVLYVPDASGRRLGINILERILMFGSTAGAGMLVWH